MGRRLDTCLCALGVQVSQALGARKLRSTHKNELQGNRHRCRGVLLVSRGSTGWGCE